jgi:hypothetical protein
MLLLEGYISNFTCARYYSMIKKSLDRDSYEIMLLLLPVVFMCTAK